MMISRQRERISSNLTSLIREQQRGKKIGSSGGGERLLGIGISAPSPADSSPCCSSSSTELVEEEVWAVGEEAIQPWDDHLRRHESNRLFRTWLASNWDVNPSANSSHSSRPSSPPINVPDWAKILRQKTRSAAAGDGSSDTEESDEDDQEKENREWIPPHEIAARIRSSMAAFSVLEGAGRTLKGRDLSRVRNAVWAQTGLID